MCREFYGISAQSAKPWFLQISFRVGPYKGLMTRLPTRMPLTPYSLVTKRMR